MALSKSKKGRWQNTVLHNEIRLRDREKIAKTKRHRAAQCKADTLTCCNDININFAPRGVEGRPMPLKTHQKKLYFADDESVRPKE